MVGYRCQAAEPTHCCDKARLRPTPLHDAAGQPSVSGRRYAIAGGDRSGSLARPRSGSAMVHFPTLLAEPPRFSHSMNEVGSLTGGSLCYERMVAVGDTSGGQARRRSMFTLRRCRVVRRSSVGQPIPISTTVTAAPSSAPATASRNGRSPSSARCPWQKMRPLRTVKRPRNSGWNIRCS